LTNTIANVRLFVLSSRFTIFLRCVIDLIFDENLIYYNLNLHNKFSLKIESSKTYLISNEIYISDSSYSESWWEYLRNGKFLQFVEIIMW